MKRKLFLEKLSDKKLRELVDLLEELDNTGVTGNETLCHYANTWYDNRVGMERFICLQIDVYREVVCRWR